LVAEQAQVLTIQHQVAAQVAAKDIFKVVLVLELMVKDMPAQLMLVQLRHQVAVAVLVDQALLEDLQNAV
jgi:hypothetical protein